MILFTNSHLLSDWRILDSFKDLILEVEGDLCSRLSHQGEQDMECGPVIHVMTNPLECVVEPMLRINEINLQREKRV